MTRERIAQPKHKKATPIPVSKTPVAQGSRETTRATGGVIIVREHIAKMWEQTEQQGRSRVRRRRVVQWTKFVPHSMCVLNVNNLQLISSEVVEAARDSLLIGQS
jgi:hypothetical protein